MTLLIHIAAGAVAIVAGYAALAAAKGAGLHRRSGTVFVWAMVTMGLFAAWLAAASGEVGNVTAGLMAAYLVVTALTAVRTETPALRRVELGAMLVALAVGVTGVALPVWSMTAGSGMIDGVPAQMYLMFGVIALIAFGGDVRMIRSGRPRGARRITRHLWRMCFALWIATGSFFGGQADEIPEALRIAPLLAVLAFLPLPAMVYWLWRVRRGPPLRAAARASRPARMVNDRLRRVAAQP
ncbi:MAG TPA: hypothetical protein VFR37_04720 [Longimicrobium sp.]|nr:hypothetical protein [Longimicrobium sp.]